LSVFCCTLIGSLPGQAQSGPFVSYGKHAVSPPLRDIVVNPFLMPAQQVIPVRHPMPEPAFNPQPDPGLQTSQTPILSSISLGAGLNFEGTDLDPAFCNCAPPDTNMAVGTSSTNFHGQVVQWVNAQFSVFDKTNGAILKADIPGNSPWAGLTGSQCANNNSGDPIAQFDAVNGRWVLLQPVFSAPYAICIAVSKTNDALGSYNAYEFDQPSSFFPDYPKLGIWPNAYFSSANIFLNASSFDGARVCAYDSAAMVAGTAATQICFQTSTSFGSLLPSDLDGTTVATAGEPNFFMNFGSNSLNLWKFSVNFTTGSSSFTGPTNIPVAPFTEACGGGSCIPQESTSQRLDSLADRLMYRLAYRNLGTHESLVVNHSVFVSGNRRNQVDGERWYEIQNPNGTPIVAQDGTYSPDSNSRWMGSMAMNKFGDIALGYSVSSGSTHPAIRYTGRLAADTSGMMTLPETSIIEGGGSQTPNLNRWGDYSAMRIDPSDGCTFWYTTEYLKATGNFNWDTRIGSFKIVGSGC